MSSACAYVILAIEWVLFLVIGGIILVSGVGQHEGSPWEGIQSTPMFVCVVIWLLMMILLTIGVIGKSGVCCNTWGFMSILAIFCQILGIVVQVNTNGLDKMFLIYVGIVGYKCYAVFIIMKLPGSAINGNANTNRNPTQVVVYSGNGNDGEGQDQVVSRVHACADGAPEK